jgi:coenzyme F420-0:L-glutamate ligase/coenzyme F420-1:gamma-L-glutamate ligase
LVGVSARAVQLIPVEGLPEITAGADLAEEVAQALARTKSPLLDGDVLVLTHKIVAKAEGAVVDLKSVTPSAMAIRFAARWAKDPRQVEVVLQQSERVLRMDRGVLIVETRHGLICANAGVDHSNSGAPDQVCVLPENPDRSARAVRERMQTLFDIDIAVVISDTFGRPWRDGLTNIAIGVAGMRPLRDYVGMRDSEGRPLQVTKLAVADEIASAAELVMGKLDRVPAAVVRGFAIERGPGGASELVRRPDLDMFRY